MAVARIVFADAERGLPALPRGWRTPDPSPTRTAMNLPHCGPKLCSIEMESELLGDPMTPRDQSNPLRSGTSASDLSDSFPLLEAPSTRTPSLSPVRQVWGNGKDDELRKQAPSTPTASTLLEPTPSGGTSGTNVDPVVRNDIPQSLMMISAPPPPHPPPPCVPVSVVQAPGTWVGVGSSFCVPSFGSVGHPFTCADFCKYAKKDRGCKDGADCDRCHLCTKKKDRKVPVNMLRKQRRYGGHCGRA